uniref:Uncharacterized protein n=1 Tax=Oryza brachyantha TaxID=4533 RepID=J3KUQ2_ORYBR
MNQSKNAQQSNPHRKKKRGQAPPSTTRRDDVEAANKQEVRWVSFGFLLGIGVEEGGVGGEEGRGKRGWWATTAQLDSLCSCTHKEERESSSSSSSKGGRTTTGKLERNKKSCCCGGDGVVVVLLITPATDLKLLLLQCYYPLLLSLSCFQTTTAFFSLSERSWF